MSRITLYTLNDYYQVLSNFNLPNNLSKDILVDVIMEKCGMLPPYHQQPQALKRNIQNWFSRMYTNFERMYNALYADYSPIHNYDRYEEWSDSHNSDVNNVNSATNSYSGESIHTISAYNSATYQPYDKDLDSNSNSSNNTNNIKTNSDNSHNGHIYGNIGVKTTQSMIDEELELRKYDLYNEIAEMFENYFIIQYYA